MCNLTDILPSVFDPRKIYRIVFRMLDKFAFLPYNIYVNDNYSMEIYRNGKRKNG